MYEGWKHCAYKVQRPHLNLQLPVIRYHTENVQSIYYLLSLIKIRPSVHQSIYQKPGGLRD
jgi:hypothetical protein